MISSAYLFPRTDNPIGPVLPLNFGMLIWGLDDKPPMQVNSITFFLNSDKLSSDCPLIGAPIKGQSDDNLSELRKKVMEFTCIGGLSSRPQISIPKFKGSTGPIGLSVLGNKYADEIILNNLNLF